MSTPTHSQAAALRTAIDTLMRRFKIAESEVSGGKHLNQIDMQVMLYVSAHEACGPTDIARHLGVAPTTITSATDRLARHDYLRRERPEEDRRAIALRLTPDGESYVSNLIDVQTDHCRMMLEALSGGDQDTLIRLISTIAKNEY
ncbi:MarR family winged helix-turn-helix transcriptional regulator [Hoeflea ulvae]|uniref:MarR family winged helix-turn-helix transcriptional regulator n=1 Tax=Hoeflea ulvae TaxID=2983764 RepID=A0ABT3YJC0_9HYPH|nr:MarR family winged helix-turn-helix transcriptional regulator [Hoeflea ulvae]MCY0095994.1 MarR family winged helix-turn-helix transcriptional regulator [Hoeflea ulvae]